LKEFRLGIGLHALVNLKVAMCSRPFGMDNPLGNALSIKMSHLLNKLDIMQQYWTTLANGQRVLIISNWYTLISRQVPFSFCHNTLLP
jgi:hypothetical protein